MNKFKNKNWLLTKVKIMIDKFLRGGEVGGGLKGDHEINSNEYAGVRFTYSYARVKTVRRTRQAEHYEI